MQCKRLLKGLLRYVSRKQGKNGRKTWVYETHDKKFRRRSVRVPRKFCPQLVEALSEYIAQKIKYLKCMVEAEIEHSKGQEEALTFGNQQVLLAARYIRNKVWSNIMWFRNRGKQSNPIL